MYISGINIREALVYVGVIVAAILATSSLLLGIAKLSETSCKEIASMMGTEYSHSLKTDCMIKKNGNWIPLKNLREI